jgi:hypothetical protein
MNEYQHKVEQLLQQIEQHTQRRYRLEAANAYADVERELAGTRERLAELTSAPK